MGIDETGDDGPAAELDNLGAGCASLQNIRCLSYRGNLAPVDVDGLNDVALLVAGINASVDENDGLVELSVRDRSQQDHHQQQQQHPAPPLGAPSLPRL